MAAARHVSDGWQVGGVCARGVLRRCDGGLVLDAVLSTAVWHGRSVVQDAVGEDQVEVTLHGTTFTAASFKYPSWQVAARGGEDQCSKVLGRGGARGLTPNSRSTASPAPLAGSSLLWPSPSTCSSVSLCAASCCPSRTSPGRPRRSFSLHLPAALAYCLCPAVHVRPTAARSVEEVAWVQQPLLVQGLARSPRTRTNARFLLTLAAVLGACVRTSMPVLPLPPHAVHQVSAPALVRQSAPTARTA